MGGSAARFRSRLPAAAGGATVAPMTAALFRSARVFWAGPLAALAVLLFAAPALAQTVFWELEPVRDPAFEVGTFVSIGGRTAPEGVSFKLLNSKATQPQVLTLVSTSTNQLRLIAFKDGQPFVDQTTDASGKLTVRFRTGEEMRFRVSGPAGATYQLSLWRGPEIVEPPPSPVVSMESVIGSGGAAVAGGKGAAAPAAADAPAKAGGGPGVMMYLLLGGILVALVAIAVLIFLGQRRKAAT